MGFFRKPRELPEGEFSSKKYKRPLELGTRPSRITSFMEGTFGKTVVPVRTFVSNPFSIYNTPRDYLRKRGTIALLQKAYAQNEAFMKIHASGVQKIIPALKQPQIMPFGDQILRAMGGIEERLARIEKGNPRKMDKETAFAHLGITRRLTIPELEILKRIEANRQYVLRATQSTLREIARAALSPKATRDKILDDVKNRQPVLIANKEKALQELWENQHLYAQLEQEYTAMHQRMIGKEGKEEFMSTAGRTSKL